MPEIEFTIDQKTGKLNLHVKGVPGPACGDVAKLAKELLGEPGLEQTTAEYYLRPRVRPQIKPRPGQRG